MDEITPARRAALALYPFTHNAICTQSSHCDVCEVGVVRLACSIDSLIKGEEAAIAEEAKLAPTWLGDAAEDAARPYVGKPWTPRVWREIAGAVARALGATVDRDRSYCYDVAAALGRTELQDQPWSRVHAVLVTEIEGLRKLLGEIARAGNWSDGTAADLPALVTALKTRAETDRTTCLHCGAPNSGPIASVRRKVARFAYLMEQKLKANDGKGGWNRMSNAKLLTRLRQETKELERVLDGIHPDTPGNVRASKADKIGYEAADVANFAMMLADNAGALKP